jgi:hypothetical protein
LEEAITMEQFEAKVVEEKLTETSTEETVSDQRTITTEQTEEITVNIDCILLFSKIMHRAYSSIVKDKVK